MKSSSKPSEVTSKLSPSSTITVKEPTNETKDENVFKSRDSDSSDSEYDSDSAEEQHSVNVKALSEKEINEISAKILRAELMGNEVRAKSFLFHS